MQNIFIFSKIYFRKLLLRKSLDSVVQFLKAKKVEGGSKRHVEIQSSLPSIATCANPLLENEIRYAGKQKV
ncbi:MAG: hypothetical protein LBH08_03625 [Puniceicoccales bacterium]|nr:hypothetical protein [Puniceicoccales bacterium]